MEGEELSLKEKVDMLYSSMEEGRKPRKRKIKIPRRAKVNRRKMKKGWVGIIRIDENGSIAGERQQIEDSSYRLKDGTYHSSDGKEMLMWEGKWPVVIQSVKRKNPTNFMEEENETYGQKYIMARMLKDAIKVKRAGGNIILWLVIIGAILFGVNYFLGGGI